MRWHRYNPEPEQRGFTKSERAQIKQYLFAKRFLDVLPFPVVKCMAKKYGDNETLAMPSKAQMVEDLCSINEFLDAATKKGHGNSIKFALRKCLSQKDREKLMKLMGITAKGSEMATINYIYDTLKIGLQLPVEEIPSIREELKQLRKEDRQRLTKKKVKAKRKKVQKRKEQYKDRYLEIVVAYLFEAAKADYLGKRLSMKDYAAQQGLEYTTFTRHVKKLKTAARGEAKTLFDRWLYKHEEPRYRQLVIEYLAEREFRKEEGVLSRNKFAQERNADYELLNYFHKKFKLDDTVLAEAREYFRGLEEGRLSVLRESPKPKEIAAWDALFEEPKPEIAAPKIDVRLLERLAKKKLPIKKGLPVFSKDPAEQNRKLEMWLEIAEDVIEIGLHDPVVEKYEHEFLLPEGLDPQTRRYLIKLEMEKVLKQLDLFDPSKDMLTFKRLRDWKEKRDERKAAKRAKEEQEALEAAQQAEIEDDLEEEVDDTVYDEEWLAREIAREEAEALAEQRRYADTPEERELRRQEGLLYHGSPSRDVVSMLQGMGAIYDDGIWLVPTRQDLDALTADRHTRRGLENWARSRKPRLLVGIGTTDYTKDWMNTIFDLRTVDRASKVHSQIETFEPDALMIYTSSSGKTLQRVMAELSKTYNLPLITFDSGFSDALLSAERQGVEWFIEAYVKRKQLPRRLRRFNPIPNPAYLVLRRNPEEESQSFDLIPVPEGSYLPSLPPVGEIPQGQPLIPRASLDVMISGKFPLIRVREGQLWKVKPRVVEALAKLITVEGLANINAWYDLDAFAGNSADLYVMDSHGERYKVEDVLHDYGGETGQLVLRHLGRRSRGGKLLYIDIWDAYKKMVPFIVYRDR